MEIAEMDTKLTGRFRFNENDELVSIYFIITNFDLAKLVSVQRSGIDTIKYHT